MLGNQHRKPFVKQVAKRTTKTIEHLSGPINTMPLGKSSYFITFVDDYSRKFKVFMLKQKSNAFEAFKTFKLMAKKQIRNALKVLRIDGGKEYYFSEFRNFCA